MASPIESSSTRRLPARRRRQMQPVGPPARSAALPHDPRNVIELRHVAKHYGDGTIGLEDATMNVRRGEFLFLVGSTGSGKSTIMKLLSKQLEPTHGTIMVAGRDLSEITRKRVPYYRRNLAWCSRTFKLLPNRTVYDNVAYALSATGAGRKEIRAKVPDILRLTGLSTKLHQYPPTSFRRRAAARLDRRAFVNHPPLVLADEPTGNLDPQTSIGSCSCCTASTARAPRCSSPRTTTTWSTRCAAAWSRSTRGRIVRDEAAGMYAAGEQTTDEFGAMMRDVEVGRVRERLDHLQVQATMSSSGPIGRRTPDELLLLHARGVAFALAQRPSPRSQRWRRCSSPCSSSARSSP